MRNHVASLKLIIHDLPLDLIIYLLFDCHLNREKRVCRFRKRFEFGANKSLGDLDIFQQGEASLSAPVNGKRTRKTCNGILFFLCKIHARERSLSSISSGTSAAQWG